MIPVSIEHVRHLVEKAEHTIVTGPNDDTSYELFLGYNNTMMVWETNFRGNETSHDINTASIIDNRYIELYCVDNDSTFNLTLYNLIPISLG